MARSKYDFRDDSEPILRERARLALEQVTELKLDLKDAREALDWIATQLSDGVCEDVAATASMGGNWREVLKTHGYEFDDEEE